MDPGESQRRFEAIYLAHYAAVLSYVRRRTAGPDDVADAIAETFTTAWRRLDDIPAGDEALLWLYGVARRVLANHRRGETRRTALAERLRAELAAWTEPAEQGDHAAVRAAFHRLTEDDRELLSLVGWEGLNTAEIATVLGCTRGAVRLRLHRARKRLAKELESAGLDLARYGARATALVEGQS
jgi:RNA polymerase sigma factor (sigma-70 family)